jgi:hypothetical protein
MNTFLSNFPGFAMSQLKQSAAWVYKQDYTSLYNRVFNSKEGIMFSCMFLMAYIVVMMIYIYIPRVKPPPRVNKRKLEDDVFEEQNRHIKRRLSIQAEKYRHASAFQTIQQQVGEDPRSWPVILLNEVILLREDLARVQKKEF